METRRGASWRASPADGLDDVPRVAVARLADVPDRRVRALGDEATAALLYPELAPLAGRQRDDRPRRRLLRRRRSLPGHARRDARRLGPRGAPLRARDGAQPPDGRPTWLAHTAYEYGRMLLRRGDGDRARAAELLGEATRARRADRHACAARAGSRRSARRARRPGLPDGLSFREVQILGLVAGGLSNREIGSDAVHQRAHRGEPHPQHPAQDALREPHRGGVLRPPPRAGRASAR